MVSPDRSLLENRLAPTWYLLGRRAGGSAWHPLGSWVARGKVLPMPEEIATAAVVESHRQGKLVFSHPSNLARLEVALRANVHVLAHAIEDTGV